MSTAERYFRCISAIAASHVLGLAWPPPGGRLRTRIVGHWGANPGIAWIVGHLAQEWVGDEPFRLVIGTGHATSFMLAHDAVRNRLSAAALTRLFARYGQVGGDPSEIPGHPEGGPQLFGELGSAAAVSQGLARATGASTICVVGDGECETPVALAAIAHSSVIIKPTEAHWMLVINANGSRMGGAARFSANELRGLLEAFGYEVLVSDLNPVKASAAAGAAIRAMQDGRMIAWISCTPKGWPAPTELAGQSFVGHHAHKIPTNLDLTAPAWVELLSEWVAKLARGTIDDAGRPHADIRTLALRAAFDGPLCTVAEEPYSATIGRLVSGSWRSPAEAVDETVAARGVQVFSPDEASSNRLLRCLQENRVIEVLAEEVCFAWAVGTTEGGRRAAFATYEAFAPLITTQLAQYAKLLSSRSPRGTPPLAVLVSSLGLANTPSHQNTDLVASFLSRQSSRVRLLCPVGATSAKHRLNIAYRDMRDSIFGMIYSKQVLPDPKDPGGAIIAYSQEGVEGSDGTIVAVGDVCVAEALAAMSCAAARGTRLRVLAVVDLASLNESVGVGDGVLIDREPVIATVWCSPSLINGTLWRYFRRIFTVHGYQEKSGATARETMIANKLDRYSLLRALWPEMHWARSRTDESWEVVPPFPQCRLVASNLI